MALPRKPGWRPTPEPHQIEVIDDITAASLRRMTGLERLAMMEAMMREARRSIEHVLTREHPEWSPLQVRQETARRMSRGAA